MGIFKTSQILLFGLILIITNFPVVNSRNSVTQQIQNDFCYCLDEIASGIYSPTGAQFIPGHHDKDDDDDEEETKDMTILIVEQRGVIRSLKGGHLHTFLDIRDRVYATDNVGDSRGLLSAVLSPNYNKDKMVYVYYIREVNKQHYSYVSQFHAVNGKVDPSTERFLLRVLQPFEHGNGGPMFFGDDGYLYIVVGDGGATDDMEGYAQSKNSFYGSILRIDPTNGQDFTGGHSGVAKMYSVPSDNPFHNTTKAAIKEIFAFGFRNPWGCSVDSKQIGGDGRIYCVETGTDQFDEVNIIENGKNYGWHLKEGTTCLNVSICGVIENEGLPIFEFQHVSHHALVGGYVYRGKDLAWMKGKGYYTFADIVTGETYYLQENKTRHMWEVHQWPLCDVKDCPGSSRDRPLTHLFGFAQDHQGELYMLMVDEMKALSPKGKMYKVTPPNRSASNVLSPYFLLTICMVLVSLMATAFQKNQNEFSTVPRL